jgi:hypothetical protein
MPILILIKKNIAGFLSNIHYLPFIVSRIYPMAILTEFRRKVLIFVYNIQVRNSITEPMRWNLRITNIYNVLSEG